MKKIISLFVACVFLVGISCKEKTNKTTDNQAGENKITNQVDTSYITDTYKTNDGDLLITLVGHASLIFQYDDKVIHIDPYSGIANYQNLPKADLILLTHEHPDHLDTAAINLIKKPDTKHIMSKSCHDILKYGDIIKNGDSIIYDKIEIRTIPAYNIVSKNSEGNYWHPKGVGNGYILTFADKKVYVAGDTENIPEMEELNGKIDIAFLPKNQPYTMSDDMFLDAVQKVQPRHLYPYHFSEYNIEILNKQILEKNKDMEIHIRPMSHIKC